MVAVGLALTAVLILRNDPRVLFALLSQLSWRIVLAITLPYMLVNAFDTLAWRFSFRESVVPFRTLFAARLVGEAVNLTTASVGGETLKAWVLRPHVGLEVSTPSVIIAKTTIVISQGLLLVAGMVCAWWALPAGSFLLRAMAWLLLVEVLAVAVFVAAQVGGMFARGGRLLTRLGWPSAYAGGGALVRLDDSLSAFYRRAPRRLLLSIGFHFLGALATALETWVILSLLGIEVSVVTVLVIEAFSTAVRFATFMVPGSLGALEGGHVAVFAALGLTGAAGLSFSLVRRLREVSWAAVGYFLIAGASSYLAGSGRPPSPPASAPPAQPPSRSSGL
jgi:uncharacterized protein (TIRG00374 family)